MTDQHPAIKEKLDFLTNYNHLPEPLFSVARVIGTAAEEIVNTVESSSQITIGLQHLIDAKDCFVRAKVVEVNKAKGNSGNPAEPLPRPDEVV
ncbi:hypothetical protein [Streptomyces hebeiensis]